MAESSEFALETELLNRFGDTPMPVLSAIGHKEYSDIEFKNMEVYSLDDTMKLTHEQLSILGRSLMKKLEEGSTDENTVHLLFLLAINIRKTSDVDSWILRTLDWGNKSIFPMSKLDVKSTIEGTAASHQYPVEFERKKTEIEIHQEALNKFVMPDIKGLPQAEAEERIEESRMIAKRNAWADYEADYETRRQAWEAESSKGKQKYTKDSQYWPFLAAYLLKIFVKSPENVHLGLRNMKERYIGFYPGGIAPDISLGMDALTNLAIRIKPYKQILQTWIGLNAEYESSIDSTLDDAGLVRYLANIQFGYNGMHGYGLFREVLLATKWKPGQAIVKMWMDPTQQALETIHHIIRNYERTVEATGSSNLSRKTYFKYARAVDPRFFLSLQPSQCLTLLYICSQILNHYVRHTQLANPLNMIALQRLGSDQKEYLDIFVKTIIHEDDMDLTKRTALEQKAILLYKEKQEAKNAVAVERDEGPSIMSDLRAKMLAAKGSGIKK